MEKMGTQVKGPSFQVKELGAKNIFQPRLSIKYSLPNMRLGDICVTDSFVSIRSFCVFYFYYYFL